MRLDESYLELSATDLSQFLSCRHRTGLDLFVAQGALAAPTWVDPVLAVLQERGLQHEQAYAQSLRSLGLNFVDLSMAPRLLGRSTRRSTSGLPNQPWLRRPPCRMTSAPDRIASIVLAAH